MDGFDLEEDDVIGSMEITSSSSRRSGGISFFLFCSREYYRICHFLTFKHWKNAHSVDYFSYIAVRMLAAFLNSAFTICFFHNLIRVFVQRTIKERCERSCSNVGKILDAYNTNVCRKFVFWIFYKFLKKFSLDFLNPKKKKIRHDVWKITVV